MIRHYELTVRVSIKYEHGDPDNLAREALRELNADAYGGGVDHGRFIVTTMRKNRRMREVLAHALARRSLGERGRGS